MSQQTPPPPPRRTGPPPAPNRGRPAVSNRTDSGCAGFFLNNPSYQLVPKTQTKTNSGAVAGKSACHGEEVTSKSPPPSMAKGGMVKKTGLHKLHKGEMVIPVKDVAKVKKALKSLK